MHYQLVRTCSMAGLQHGGPASGRQALFMMSVSVNSAERSEELSHLYDSQRVDVWELNHEK